MDRQRKPHILGTSPHLAKGTRENPQVVGPAPVPVEDPCGVPDAGRHPAAAPRAGRNRPAAGGHVP